MLVKATARLSGITLELPRNCMIYLDEYHLIALIPVIELTTKNTVFLTMLCVLQAS